MKCILKAREGFGAKILYYKENEAGQKEVYQDKNFKIKLNNIQQESIIILNEKVETIKLGGELYLYGNDLRRIKELFFS